MWKIHRTIHTDMYDFLVGLSSPDIIERFHSVADISVHGWIKARVY